MDDTKLLQSCAKAVTAWYDLFNAAPDDFREGDLELLEFIENNRIYLEEATELPPAEFELARLRAEVEKLRKLMKRALPFILTPDKAKDNIREEVRAELASTLES